MARTGKTIGWRELRVGIFTFVALAVLLFLILNASGDFNPFERKFRLKARFSNADGLREGAQVQLAGLSVGKVEEVKLLPQGAADDDKVEAKLVVSQLVDGQAVNERIRTDSSAQLVASTLLGSDKIINISPGTAAGQPVPEDYTLKSITTSSINQLTESGGDLVKQLNKLAVPVTDIAEKVNQGEGTLGRVINDPELYNSLNATLRETQATINELQSTVRRVNAGEGSAGKFLRDEELYNSLNRTASQLETLSNDLKAGRGTAGKFLRDEQLYNELRATVNETRSSIARITLIAEKFDPIINDLSEGRGTAGKFLKDEALYNEARATLAKFNSTAERVENIVSAAERGEGTLGKLIRDESLYNNVNQLTTESNKLIYDFRQNPKKYLTIKFELF